MSTSVMSAGSGHRIVEILRTEDPDLTDDHLGHLRTVAGYIRRHLVDRSEGSPVAPVDIHTYDGSYPRRDDPQRGLSAKKGELMKERWVGGSAAATTWSGRGRGSRRMTRSGQVSAARLRLAVRR